MPIDLASDVPLAAPELQERESRPSSPTTARAPKSTGGGRRIVQLPTYAGVYDDHLTIRDAGRAAAPRFPRACRRPAIRRRPRRSASTSSRGPASAAHPTTRAIRLGSRDLSGPRSRTGNKGPMPAQAWGRGGYHAGTEPERHHACTPAPRPVRVRTSGSIRADESSPHRDERGPPQSTSLLPHALRRYERSRDAQARRRRPRVSRAILRDAPRALSPPRRARPAPGDALYHLLGLARRAQPHHEHGARRSLPRAQRG